MGGIGVMDERNDLKVISNELLPVYETSSGEKIVDARELHRFLEVGRDFSNWIKDRIQKYGFIEGEDFSPILVKTSGRPAIEYDLTIEMAKELSMVENNEKGSQARKYFIAIEKRHQSQTIDIARLSPEMQMFKQIFDSVAKHQIEQAEMRKQLQSTAQEVASVRQTLTLVKDAIIQRDDDWRESIRKMFNSAVKGSQHQDFSSMRNESYKILEDRAHCNLNQRLRNLKDRLEESGATKTKIDTTNKMDVIEADPKLKEIYTNIVKELYIRFAS
jgi:anti-repressor protein